MTLGGKIVGAASMLMGILLIALPTAIIGSKFQEVYHLMETEANDAELNLTDPSLGTVM